MVADCSDQLLVIKGAAMRHVEALVDTIHCIKADAWGEGRRGLVKIKTEALKATLRKSMTNGAVINLRYPDESMMTVPTARGTSLDDALKFAAQLGEVALGVVPFKEGYGIRVMRDDEQVAKASMRKDHTDVVGMELMLTKKTDGKKNGRGGSARRVV